MEKQIALLQQAERDDSTLPPCYFIFDRDEMPSDLRDSAKVRVLQWQRRCLENYLIDVDTLTDLLQDREVLHDTLSNLGEVNKLLRELAFSQLDDLVAKAVYAGYSFEDPGIRAPEIHGKSTAEIAEILFLRLRRVNTQTTVADDWKTLFAAECERRKKEMLAIWDVKWVENCDGKRLFKDLLRRPLRFRISSRRLEKRVIQEMARNRTESWRSMESLLNTFLQ